MNDDDATRRDGEGFGLALVQMRVDAGDVDANQARAVKRIGEAAGDGAQVVVLPEALPLGWTDPSAAALAQAVPDGPFTAALRAAAREGGVYVCSGVVERAPDGTVYNAAVLIGPGGDVLIHHRKINELDIGHPYYAQGDRLAVVRTPLGTFAVAICADAYARDNVITHSLALMGAEVILSPSAWAVPADHDHEREPYGELWVNAYRPVCVEHGIWIAGASNVGPITSGPWAGRQCIGCSLLMDPDGNAAVTGPYGVDAEAIVHHHVRPRLRPRPWYHPPDRWFRPGSANERGDTRDQPEMSG